MSKFIVGQAITTTTTAAVAAASTGFVHFGAKKKIHPATFELSVSSSVRGQVDLLKETTSQSELLSCRVSRSLCFSHCGATTYLPLLTAKIQHRYLPIYH